MLRIDRPHRMSRRSLLVAAGSATVAFRLLGSAAIAAAAEVAAAAAAAAAGGTKGMCRIPAGEFWMGAVDGDEQARTDERPRHRVTVDGFWMDETELTNGSFSKFVDATKYVTTAERKPDWEELKKQLPPGTPKPPDDVLVPGSLVF